MKMAKLAYDRVLIYTLLTLLSSSLFGN